MSPTRVLRMNKAKFPPPPFRKSYSGNYIFLDFGYVIEQLVSVHLVYGIFLLQFELGNSLFHLDYLSIQSLIYDKHTEHSIHAHYYRYNNMSMSYGVFDYVILCSL